MKIIYHCFGGSHSSVTTAAIHLGLLEKGLIPSGQNLMNIPYFDRQTAADHGIFRFMGLDEEKNEVYIIGRRNYKNFEPLVRGLADMLGINQEEIVLINTMPCVTWTMMLGGFLSRKLGWIKLGRPIVIHGTQQAYAQFHTLVDQVKVIILKSIKA
ncbi:MAG: DUF3189 family protein [Bacillota bacterium]